VGAPGQDALGIDAGVAYLVFRPAPGAALGDGRAFPGAEAYNEAGAAVAGAGDLTGDGLDDLLVGAPGAYGDRRGAAFVVPGPAATNFVLTDAPAWYSGESAGDGAGDALAAGDVDGDGISDVVLGAPGRAGDDGGVFLVYGPAHGAAALSDADVAWRGDTTGDLLGVSVAVTDDVDGDGHAAVIAGAPGMDGRGAALLLGVAAMESGRVEDADALLAGEAEGDEAGAAVAAAGDPNGDGLPDLLVGAPGLSARRPDAGGVYLVSGPLSGWTHLRSAGARFRGRDLDDRVGSSLAAGGDVNGDGIDDVLLGAPGIDHGGVESGGAFLFSGRR
jgi:hypothetical protein